MTYELSTTALGGVIVPQHLSLHLSVSLPTSYRYYITFVCVAKTVCCSLVCGDALRKRDTGESLYTHAVSWGGVFAWHS